MSDTHIASMLDRAERAKANARGGDESALHYSIDVPILLDRIEALQEALRSMLTLSSAFGFKGDFIDAAARLAYPDNTALQTCSLCGHNEHADPPAGQGCGCYDPDGVCGGEAKKKRDLT